MTRFLAKVRVSHKCFIPKNTGSKQEVTKLRSRVNVLLAERRMSKRELERRLGIAHSSAWRWTSDEGIAKLPLTKLQRLANAIGCEVEDLYE